MGAHDILDHNSLHLHRVYCILFFLLPLTWPFLVVEGLIVYTSLLQFHIVVHLMHSCWIRQHSQLKREVKLALHKLTVFETKHEV